MMNYLYIVPFLCRALVETVPVRHQAQQGPDPGTPQRRWTAAGLRAGCRTTTMLPATAETQLTGFAL